MLDEDEHYVYAIALCWPAYCSHGSAASAAAEEVIAAIGFEARYACSAGHIDLAQNLTCSGVDLPHIALVSFPGAMPKFTIDPRYPGDEPVRLEGAKNRPRLGIDLMDHPSSVLSDPERSFGPGKT